MTSAGHKIENRTRFGFADTAKGIGICFVVMEHHAYISTFHPDLQKIILSFHMPLFFFISGFFFNAKYSLRQHVTKRYHSLVKPYFSLATTFMILFFLKNHDSSSLVFNSAGILYGSSQSLRWPYGTFWFFTSLFVTSVIYCIIYHFLLCKIKKAALRLCLLGLMVTCAYYGNLCFKNSSFYHELPWNLDLLLFTLFFYAVGFEYRMAEKFEKLENKYLIGIVLVILSVMHIVLYGKSGYVLNFFYRRYDDLILNTFLSLLAIFAVMAVSKEIARKRSFIFKPIAFLGERSLTIFMFHSLILAYAAKYTEMLFGSISSYLAFFLAVSLTIIISVIIHELLLKSSILSWLYLNIEKQRSSLAESDIRKQV